MINSVNEPWLNGQFLNLNLNYQYANNSYVELNYRRVTDDFSSPGSQTKRIDFSSSPNLFSTVNNNISPRDILISDLVNDITFFRQNSIYNRTIDYDLDQFNPLFGLTQPYGISTPNRQGFDLDFFYRDSVNIVNFLVGSSYLTDLTGEGTENLRSYIQFRFKAKLLINKLVNLNRQITIHAGLKSDRVNSCLLYTSPSPRDDL